MSEETQEAFSFGDTAKQLGVTSTEELAELIQMGRAAKQANEQRQAKAERRKQEEMEDMLEKILILILLLNHLELLQQQTVFWHYFKALKTA